MAGTRLVKRSIVYQKTIEFILKITSPRVIIANHKSATLQILDLRQEQGVDDFSLT